MDIVLGVSMTPASVRMLLVEGENADGVTVEQDDFDVAVDDGESVPDRVVSAVLGTREGAAEAGYRLTSTGVAVDDQAQGRRLHQALAAQKVDNVTLVSVFLSAAALTQTVGGALGYQNTALLLVEPDSATLAVVDSDDGSITEVQRTELPVDDDAAIAELGSITARAGGLASAPDGLFLVGSGVNVGMVKAELEEASPLPISVPEEPEMALARGAALASAHAPLFDSSTAALAWARDPGTGVVDPGLVELGYPFVSGADPDVTVGVGEQALAYSAVDDESDDYLSVLELDEDAGDQDDRRLVAGIAEPAEFPEPAPARRPFLLAGTAMAVFFVAGVASLVVALAIGIRPTAATQPPPAPNIIVPAHPVQAPKVPPAKPPVAPPAAPHRSEPPVQLPAPPPAAPAPVVAPPAAPAPVPAAPAPVPAAPAAPVPIPVPIPVAPPVELPAPEAPRLTEKPPAAPNNPERPKWPPIFHPPSQQPPEAPPSLPGNDGGDRPPLFPGFPGSGGDRGGSPSFPGFPGRGAGHESGLFPGLPGFGSGHGGSGHRGPGVANRRIPGQLIN